MQQRRALGPVLLWASSAIVLLGLLGMEMVLDSRRVIWLIFVAEMLLGLVLTVRMAILIGLINFALTGIWVLWQVSNGDVQMQDLLVLFLIPMAGLPMSGLRAALLTPRRARRRSAARQLMPVDSLDRVLTGLKRMHGQSQLLHVRLHTGGIAFANELLGNADGEMRQKKVDAMLTVLAGRHGWLFGNAQHSEFSILLRDIPDRQWERHFNAVTGQYPDVKLTYEIERIALDEAPAADTQHSAAG